MAPPVTIYVVLGLEFAAPSYLRFFGRSQVTSHNGTGTTQQAFHSSMWLASFPGPAQLSVAYSTESWAGPGNEATMWPCHSMLSLKK